MKFIKCIFLFINIAAVAFLLNEIKKRGDAINDPAQYAIPFYIDMEGYYKYRKVVRKMQPDEITVYFSKEKRTKRDYIKLKNMDGMVNYNLLFLPPDTFFILSDATTLLDLEIIETKSYDFHFITAIQRFKFIDHGKVEEEVSYIIGNDTVVRKKMRDPSNYRFSADSVLSKAPYLIKIIDFQNKYYIYDSNERFVYGAEGTIRELPK